MENKFLKRLLSFALVMFANVMTFAQDDFPSPAPGDIGDDEMPPQDIDSKLVFLLIAAVALGTYALLKKYKTVKN